MSTLTVDQFLDMVRQKDHGKIKYALKNGAFNINTRDEDGRTCLHFAIEAGEMDVATALIGYGIDVNIKDEGEVRETALHIALRRRHLEAAKLILEAPGLDLAKCGSQQSSKKLPKMALLEALHKSAPSGGTVTPTNGGRLAARDSYLIATRQDCADAVTASLPPGRGSVTDALVLQVNGLASPEGLLARLDSKKLRTLYLGACDLSSLPEDLFVNLQLSTLVLSENNLTSLPSSMFKLLPLEVLKLDQNKLFRIPDEIGQLRNLKVLTFNEQRCQPKLKSLPHALAELSKLEVLSFSGNEVDNLYVVPGIKSLRTLRCDRNRISQLPKSFGEMKELTSLDISHNRLAEIPCSLLELARRLVYMEYYSAELRPRSVLHDRQQLIAHLEVQSFLCQTTAMRTFRDINVAFMGETNAGKASLIEALASENGVANTDTDSSSKKFDMRHFECANGRDSFYVSAFNMSSTLLDPYLRDASMDLFVLVFDLTTLELQQSSPHIFARHINRMQMWLEAMFELAPSKPVLLVGTRAEAVRDAPAVWGCVESLIEQGRTHHEEVYLDCDHPYCILCNRRGAAHRQAALAKSKHAHPGFVDLSYQEAHPTANGHVAAGGGEEVGGGKLKMPHIIGYYEVDCKRNFPKDNKKGNVSMEQLKNALVQASRSSALGGIPTNWISYLKQLHTLAQKTPNDPLIPLKEASSLATGLDIPSGHVTLMLQYFHSRGKLVYFPNDELLSQWVVLSPQWFVGVLQVALTSLDAPRYTAQELVAIWQEENLSSHAEDLTKWLGKVLLRLHVCVALPGGGERGAPNYLLPNSLEVGHPDPDIWPDAPEHDERQVTVEFDLATPSAGFFAELVVSLLRRGAEPLEMIAEPPPLVHCHGVLFFSALDTQGCSVCRDLQPNGRQTSAYDDDVLHKVFIQLLPHLETLRVTARGPRPCCVIHKVVQFLWMHLNAAALASPEGDTNSNNIDTPFGDKQLYILCPKCVLTKQIEPVRFPVELMQSRCKAICSKWHNLGSWSRVLCGDYKVETSPLRSLSSLPASEHPRLALVLPPSVGTSKIDWCLRSRLKFLEGFEVHFLCEYPAGWHIPDAPGFRLTQTEAFVKRAGSCLGPIVNMALAVTQAVCGAQELAPNMPVVSPVVADLVKMYDYLRLVDQHITDPAQWFNKNRDRVLNLLTKCIAGVHNPYPDLFFKAGTALPADNVFSLSTGTDRHKLGRFLRIDGSSGRFGALRPLCVRTQIRWLCDMHHDEMRRMLGQ